MRSTAVVGLALVLGAATFARADDNEVQKLRKMIEDVRKEKQDEIDALRSQLNKEQDRNLERARANEVEKRKLQDELDAAKKTNAQLERDLAIARVKLEARADKDSAPPAKASGDPEADAKKRIAEQKLAFNFDATPLEEVVQFLEDVTGLNVVLCGPEGRKVTL